MCWPAIVVLLLGSVVAIASDITEVDESQKSQLAKLQFLIGNWKGVAQPQRGSTKGSWTEQAGWAWRFERGRAELAAELTDSKVFSALILKAAGEADQFELQATPAAGGEPVLYEGSLADDGKLTLIAEKSNADLPAQISIRTVAGGDRLLVIYEKRVGNSPRLTRLADVGYTRQGSSFGKGGSGPECVVTGGYGSIEVTHEGKTYYVCCTGCRDYFNEHPDEVLAEYTARKAEETRTAAESK